MGSAGLWHRIWYSQQFELDGTSCGCLRSLCYRSYLVYASLDIPNYVEVYELVLVAFGLVRKRFLPPRDDPIEFRRKIIESLWARTNITLSSCAIILFILLNVFTLMVLLRDNPPLTALTYVIVVKWSPWPWQLLSLILAPLSLAIVFLVDDAAGQYGTAARTNNQKLRELSIYKFKQIGRIIRVRLTIAIIFWFVVGGHTILFFNKLNCWFDVPANIVKWLKPVYGNEFLRSPCMAIRPVGGTKI